MTQLVVTSKMSLKLSCLTACGNNIGEAEKLYSYIIGGLTDIPDVDPVSPSIFQRADEFFGWVGSHKDDLAQGIAIVKSLRGGNEATPQMDSISGIEPPKNANAV